MAEHHGGLQARAARRSPGSLIHVGERKVDKVRITVLDYDADTVTEKEVGSVEECFRFRDTSTVTWINIDGIHDPDVVSRLGGHFGLHPLVLEDIMNTTQRPKMEDLGEAVYVVLKMVEKSADGEICADQLSLIFGENYVLSFQERPGDVFDPIRERIRKGGGRIRKMGPDYLAYALIDAVVDDYFVVLEEAGDKVETLEDDIIAQPDRNTLRDIHGLKGQMLFLRKSIWPLRDAVGRLERSESPLIKEATVIYLRDVYDHVIQIIDNIETFRDILSGILDIYLSSVSNRMNEVMKILTIIGTIFIPLTFIVGIYGMNFKFMPEIEWKWGYYVVWGIMIAVAGSLIAFFRRKKWIGKRGGNP